MITSVILLIVCICPCPPVDYSHAVPTRGESWPKGMEVGGWVGGLAVYGGLAARGGGGVWGEGVVWNHKYELHC